MHFAVGLNVTVGAAEEMLRGNVRATGRTLEEEVAAIGASLLPRISRAESSSQSFHHTSSGEPDQSFNRSSSQHTSSDQPDQSFNRTFSQHTSSGQPDQSFNRSSSQQTSSQSFHRSSSQSSDQQVSSAPYFCFLGVYQSLQ